MNNVLQLAEKIKLVIFDVDGVLTDGSLYLTDGGEEIKAFHSQDGLGMKLLMQTGVQIGIITARQSNLVAKRMASLGITHVYQGQSDKMRCYEDVCKKLGIDDNRIAYVGDDLFDLPLIRRVQLGIAVANAYPFVKKHADFVTQKQGGQGAAREVCDLIMQAQGHLESTWNQYL